MLKYLDVQKSSTRVWLMLALLALGAWSTAAIYGKRWNWPPIRSDGVGYYAYLPALFLHHDLTMATLASLPAEQFRGQPPFGPWTGINRYGEAGRYLDKYGMGVALLMLPFFLAAHAFAALFSCPPGGFALPYQIASIVAAQFYLLAGVVLLYRLLQHFFSREVACVCLAVHVFGTNLFHYATYDGSLSHVYSFFLVSAFLLSLFRCRHQRLVCSALGGFLLGLIFLTRPSNIVFGLFFALYGVSSFSDLGRMLRDRHWIYKMALFAAVFLVTVSPQLLYWKYITGHWLVYSYAGEAFNWRTPEVVNVLFSVRKGLFFWSPVLLASTAGFCFMGGKVPVYFGATVVFLPVNLYIISSWCNWWYGGSLGQRPFVESVPVFAMGLASLLAGIEGTRTRMALMLFLLAGTALSVLYTILYWRGVIPFDGMTWDRYGQIFFRR